MMKITTATTVVVLMMLPASVLAQQRTIYGSDGKVVGRAATDSQGTTTFYDASGRSSARSSVTNGGATTTIYDAASGRRTGTVQNSLK